MTEGRIYLAKSEDFRCRVWSTALATENYAKLSMGHRFGLSSLFLGLKEARLNYNHLYIDILFVIHPLA